MNKFDTYIADYLRENREVALEKIGFIKIISFAGHDSKQASVDYIFDKRITTSTALVEFIAEKAGKSKSLVAADLESHLNGVREFINIGKPYEIPQIGFIKANNRGIYEFTTFSEASKPTRSGPQPAKVAGSNNNRSVVQVISLIIALAILSGLGWQAYQFFSKKNNTQTAAATINTDTVVSADTNKKIDTVAKQPAEWLPTDVADIRYIFETTASGLRARTRTQQLTSFGHIAAYDSTTIHNTKYYQLYILKPTQLADTLRIKDSIAKFLQKDITIAVPPKQ